MGAKLNELKKAAEVIAKRTRTADKSRTELMVEYLNRKRTAMRSLQPRITIISKYKCAFFIRLLRRLGVGRSDRIQSKRTCGDEANMRTDAKLRRSCARAASTENTNAVRTKTLVLLSITLLVTDVHILPRRDGGSRLFQ